MILNARARKRQQAELFEKLYPSSETIVYDDEFELEERKLERTQKERLERLTSRQRRKLKREISRAKESCN